MPSRSSLVHLVNLTGETKTGSTQTQRFMTVGVIPWPQRPRLFSSRFTNGQWHGGSFANQRKDPPRASRRIQYHSVGKEQSSRSVISPSMMASLHLQGIDKVWVIVIEDGSVA